MLKTTKEILYQWDLNVKVFVPKEIEVHEVHFAHKNDEKALVVDVKTEDDMQAADIPNILLQSNEHIKVWFVKDGQTLCGNVLQPTPRAKPADYVYTETEILRYESLEKRISDLGNTKISSPTTGEIGQVLVVEKIDENGHPVEWKTVDNSNNKPFIVTVTQTDASYVSDKTHAEILEAYNKGQTIYAMKDNCIYYLNAVINNSFKFHEISVANGSVTSKIIMINAFMVMCIEGSLTKEAIGGSYTYADLKTADKTLVGAINELFDGLEEAGGSSADWSQNDETAQGYIQNRPFWESEPREVVVLNTEDVETDGEFFWNYEKDIGLEAGKEYTVTLDGKEYHSTAYRESNTYGELILGKLNEDEPFIIRAYSAPEGGVEGKYLDPTTAHVLTVKTMKTNVQMLEPKFVPNVIQLVDHKYNEAEGWDDIEYSRPETLSLLTRNSFTGNEEGIFLVSDESNQIRIDFAGRFSELPPLCRISSGSATWPATSGTEKVQFSKELTIDRSIETAFFEYNAAVLLRLADSQTWLTQKTRESSASTVTFVGEITNRDLRKHDVILTITATEGEVYRGLKCQVECTTITRSKIR